MEKQQYIGCPAVQDFIRFLSTRLNDHPFYHSWAKASKVQWSCASFVEAVHTYRWRSKNFAQTQAELDDYATRLRGAASGSSLDSVMAAAVSKEIQVWGGTNSGKNGKGNVASIEQYGDRYADYLARCAVAFGPSDQLPDLGDKSLIVRSNAGFTKIYALLTDGFCIYDSRVAAALGYLVVQYVRQTSHPDVPKELQFATMSSRGPRARRDASSGPYTFPSTNQRSATHFRWNMRANWVLEASLQGTGFRKHFGDRSTRAFEAALFMIGYDVQPSDTASL
jgi:hypothetical protein